MRPIGRPGRAGEGKGISARVSGGVTSLALAAVTIAAVGVTTAVIRQSGNGIPEVTDSDVERNLGESVDVAGYRVTVTRAMFLPKLNEFENAGYLAANVTIVNVNARTDWYRTLDHWRLAPEKPILNGTGRVAVGGLKQLYTVRLAKGESIPGQVVWETGTKKGVYSLIFRSPGANRGAAIWKVRL